MAACCACCPLHISPTHTSTTLLAYEGLLLCEQRLQHGGLLRLLLHLSLLEGHHGLRHGGGGSTMAGLVGSTWGGGGRATTDCDIGEVDHGRVVTWKAQHGCQDSSMHGGSGMAVKRA